MSYYFPIGVTNALSTTNIDSAILATTASVPINSNVSALTASYAITTLDPPVAGPPGTSVTQVQCESDTTALITGPAGSAGATGSGGPDRAVCPPNTVRCINLEPSLSADYNDGVTRGVNYYVSAGSQFSIVCMEIPTTCSILQAEAGCPDYLPITAPAIP